jgi:uncharacterized protein (DUF58 family)
MQYLNPQDLNSLCSLKLVAKLIVEGFYTGTHKGPYFGFNIDFSEHRPYTRGEDLRFLDWKLYAGTDKYYIKKFEEETNLRIYILLDTSNSMNYGDKIKKITYGKFLVSGLVYLASHQGDYVGFLSYDNDVRKFIPA